MEGLSPAGWKVGKEGSEVDREAVKRFQPRVVTLPEVVVKYHDKIWNLAPEIMQFCKQEREQEIRDGNL